MAKWPATIKRTNYDGSLNGMRETLTVINYITYRHNNFILYFLYKLLEIFCTNILHIPWPHIQLIRYGNETNNYISTVKSILRYKDSMLTKQHQYCFTWYVITSIIQPLHQHATISYIIVPTNVLVTSSTHLLLSLLDGDILRTSYREYPLHTWINHKNVICLLYFNIRFKVYVLNYMFQTLVS